jgi:hypothetical protein
MNARFCQGGGDTRGWGRKVTGRLTVRAVYRWVTFRLVPLYPTLVRRMFIDAHDN